MSAPKVDVLAVLDSAIQSAEVRVAAARSLDAIDCSQRAVRDLYAARAAVAELIEKTAALVSVGKRFRNTVVETRGVRGMDDHDAALRAAETALARIGGAE